MRINYALKGEILQVVGGISPFAVILFDSRNPFPKGDCVEGNPHDFLGNKDIIWGEESMIQLVVALSHLSSELSLVSIIQ